MQIEHQTDRRDTGVLLDIRGHSEAASAGALARCASSAVTDVAGLSIDATVTVLRPEGGRCTGASADGAGELSRWDQHTGSGPVARALAGSMSLILNDDCPDSRWPDYPGSLRAAGFRSAMSVPLQLDHGYRAALALYSAEARVFSPAVATRTLVFSDVAARSLQLALNVRANLMHSAQLRAAITSRTAINTASGVLMSQNRCSYEEAGQLLARAAALFNLTVRDVAEGILRTLPGGTPATHFQQGT